MNVLTQGSCFTTFLSFEAADEIFVDAARQFLSAASGSDKYKVRPYCRISFPFGMLNCSITVLFERHPTVATYRRIRHLSGKY